MQPSSVNKESLLKKIATSMSFIFLSSISSICFSQTLIPLEKFISERNISDPGEFAYLGNRCSSLYSMVAGVLRENGTKKDAQTVSTMEQRSLIFRNVSLALDLGANKKSVDAVIAQSKQFNDVYIKQMIKNKQTNNSYFEGYVVKDLEVCSAVYPRFEDMNQKIPK